MKLRIGGFFSGIGAHISACEKLKDRADFQYVFQCEIDKKTAQASDDIHGTIPNLGDITQVHDLNGALAVDILYWTPPCQDISIARAGNIPGNAKGSGTRSSLAYEVPRILSATKEEDRPRYLVMEEVPTMITKFKSNFDALLAELSEIGYHHEYGIINATDCGMPQSRRRAFMVSKLHGSAPQLPAPIPLNTCMWDYLDPEPLPQEYYVTQTRLEGMILSTQKERAKGHGFSFNPTDGHGVAKTITAAAGSRKTDNYLTERPSGIIRAATLQTFSLDHMNRVYSPKGNCPTIATISGGGLEPKIMRNADKERTRITKLTEHECLLLQGFSPSEADCLVKAVDNNGRRKYPKSVCYRFAGNAVCVNCFERITEQILNDLEGST